MMKKVFVLMTGAALLLSGCGTYTGQGAYVGAQFGTVLGSAIGGISGGWRGRDMGTIVGMAGGAAVGAAIGSAADQKQNGGYTAAQPRTYDPTQAPVEPGYSVNYNSQIEIRNARFIDADHDGVLQAGEECKVTFEIMNHSPKTLYDVQPTVFDVTGNKHIHISPNLHVESIAPNSGVRYTASILADRKLKDGTAIIRIAVAQGNKEITSQVQEFSVQTRRKKK